MTDTYIDSKNNLPERVLFYGRTLPEYIKMFDLDLAGWENCKILDCPAGPSSFVYEASRQGFDVVGCDPLYKDELKLLIENGKSSIEKTLEILSGYSHLLSQKFYPNLESMKEYATSALQRFALDYPVGRSENRYVAAALPNLPFDNQSFDLVLSGNFLFIYSKIANSNLAQFDYEFHRDAVGELLRVSKGEVRVFPIPCRSGQLNEYAEKLLIDLEKDGIGANLIPVEYEFIQGGNLMLRLTR